MGLETATYVHELVSSNPASTDNTSVGDDHLRMIKATLLATFPNFAGAMTSSHTELNKLDGVDTTGYIQGILANASDAAFKNDIDAASFRDGGTIAPAADLTVANDVSVYLLDGTATTINTLTALTGHVITMIVGATGAGTILAHSGTGAGTAMSLPKDANYTTAVGDVIVFTNVNSVWEVEIFPAGGHNSNTIAASGVATANIADTAVTQAKLATAVLTSIQDSSFVYDADTGAADAYVITLSPVPSAYAEGQTFWFKAANTNTGVSTLNVNSLGAKTIKKSGTTDLAAGDIVAGLIYMVTYDGTNFQVTVPGSSFGNITTGTITSGDIEAVSTTAGAAIGPTIATYRNITGAASNKIGEFQFHADNASDAKKQMGGVYGEIITATAAAEDAKLVLETIQGGTLADRGFIGNGLVMGAGTDPGAGKISALNGVYHNIYQLPWVKIANSAASTSSSIDFTSLSSSIPMYMWIVKNYKLSSSTETLGIRTTTDGGTTWDATAADYYSGYRYQDMYSGTEGSGYGGTGATELQVQPISNPAQYSQLVMVMFSHGEAYKTTFKFFGMVYSNTTPPADGKPWYYDGGGVRYADEDVDGVRFLPTAGTITVGDFELYALVA